MTKIISEIIKTRISKVYLRDDDILVIDIEPDHHFDTSDYNELVEAAYQIGGGKRFKNLIIVGEHTVPDHDSRTLSTSEKGSRFKIADAFVIHSTVQAIIANVYMRIHKPFVPTKFFKNVKEAEEWLKQFDDK